MTSGIRPWLETLGLAHNAAALEANDVGITLLPRLNEQVLQDTGVASAGNRYPDDSLHIYPAVVGNGP